MKNEQDLDPMVVFLKKMEFRLTLKIGLMILAQFLFLAALEIVF